jgi:hypothetical protein
MSERPWNLALYKSKKECKCVGWKKKNASRNLSVISEKRFVKIKPGKDRKRCIIETVIHVIKRTYCECIYFANLKW